MNERAHKWLAIAICLGTIGAILASGCGDKEVAAHLTGTCEYANEFEDSGGQVWSVINIKTNAGCEDVIPIAMADAKQNTGGGRETLPAGWSCDGGGRCEKLHEYVTYELEFRGG